MDPNHDVYVGPIGMWMPWDPDAYKTGRVEHMEDELNQLMHEKTVNETSAKNEFEKHVKETKQKAIEENKKNAEKYGTQVTQTIDEQGNLVNVNNLNTQETELTKNDEVSVSDIQKELFEGDNVVMNLSDGGLSEIRNKMKGQIPKEYLPMWLREREIEMRQVEFQDLLKPQKTPPYKNTWMKPAGKLPTDERIHQALLLYVSDMGLLGTAVNPHGMNFMSKKFQGASLDHAMWFHSKMNFNDWVLYQIDSPVSSNARGFSRGSIYTKAGKLIASTSQEGLMRVWD